MRTDAKAILRLLAAAIGALLIGIARAQDAAPDVLVKTVTLEVVDLIAKDREVRTDSRAKLMQLIDAKVLPHFNFTAMAMLATGQSWKSATADQKERLSQEFKTLLVRTYASALSAYGDQKLEFRPLRAKPADTDVTVNVRVLQSGAQPVAIDYSMERTAAGWKVYDVAVGGVSLIANYRTEFSRVLREDGVEGLIRTLQAKNRPREGTQVTAQRK